MIYEWYGGFMTPSTYLSSVFLQVAFTFLTTSQTPDRQTEGREEGKKEGMKTKQARKSSI